MVQTYAFVCVCHTRSQKFGMGCLASPPSVLQSGSGNRASSFPFPEGLGAVPRKTGVRRYNLRDFFWKSVCDSLHFWRVLGVFFFTSYTLLRKLCKSVVIYMHLIVNQVIFIFFSTTSIWAPCALIDCCNYYRRIVRIYYQRTKTEILIKLAALHYLT